MHGRTPAECEFGAGSALDICARAIWVFNTLLLLCILRDVACSFLLLMPSSALDSVVSSVAGMKLGLNDRELCQTPHMHGCSSSDGRT